MNFPIKAQNNAIKNETNIVLNEPKLEISENVLNIIILSVSIIVVVIPERLPLAVTLSLAANYICTDKTGTLTKNEMIVFKVLTAKNQIQIKKLWK